MRLRHRDGTVVHVSYCTNIHRATDVDGVLDLLGRFAEPVRLRLGAPLLGLGLWLAAEVASQLASDEAACEKLRLELSHRGLEVVTLNGFPYGDFGAPVVKHAVYRPDWSEAARAAYTRDLAVVLARLLPEDVSEGSISTLPLGWAVRWDAHRTALARRLLQRLADRLEVLEHRTGKHVRIGFEPEPGCVVESTSDAIEHLAGLDPRHFGVCLDCCHLAVAGEDPATALRLLDQAHIPVVKVQASCAVEADPGAPGALERLRHFDEPRFLHQVRTESHGSLLGTDDLGEALDGGLPTDDAWRVHFHVPVHTQAPPPLRTTQPELQSALAGLLGGDVARTSHVDVETYTWEVLPEQVRPTGDDGLVAGLADELAWTRDRLIDLGLEVTR